MYTSFDEMGEGGLQEDMEAGGYTLLGAWNDPQSYEDSLYAILMKGTGLFEYEDSHCSCNGFEFNPQPVTKDYLLRRQLPSYGPASADEFAALIEQVRKLNIK